MRARISDCGRYRYELWRDVQQSLDAPGGCVLFVMLNPSTADATEDDATIRRCIGFARDWGFDALAVGNLYAYRATNPRELGRVNDPIGPENNDALFDLTRQASEVVCAWGASPFARESRIEYVRSILWATAKRPAKCLGLTSGGQPRHPLRLASETELIEYMPREQVA